VFAVAFAVLCALIVMPLNTASGASQGAMKMRTDNVMVIMGASYAKGWPIESLGGMQVVNKGVGGDETDKMLARFDKDVISQKPKAVLIWGFINDIFRAPRAEVEAATNRSRENLINMVERARARGITPMLATEVTVRRPAGWLQGLQHFAGRMLGKESYQDYINRHVKEVNAWIREFGKQHNIQVLDFESVLASDGGERAARYAAEDGSHLSAEAYGALTPYARSVLEKN
jgi:lysophospholipase L1-like esterase